MPYRVFGELEQRELLTGIAQVAYDIIALKDGAKKTKEMVKEIADKMDACDWEVLRKLERLPDLNEIPVQAEKGVALLAEEDDERVPEGKIASHVHANVGDEPILKAVHPVLRNYLLNSDIPSQSPDTEGQGLDEGSGVTVLDMLRSIDNDPRKPITQREWAALNDDVRRAVADAFENWVATEEERSDGLRRIDYLRGRETTGFAEAQVF